MFGNALEDRPTLLPFIDPCYRLPSPGHFDIIWPSGQSKDTMNMFKKSRKGKDQEDILGSSNDATPMSKASRALTRKKKKQEVAEEPIFDLSQALPDSNDFRTSLLMPAFSARFSMLREQDDPNTLIGKASDDSVLFPKRNSRLMLFNNNNNNTLTDIAEVESIHSAFRPPFADERSASMSDGYASDDGGSMMNRTRPGEGNNLFGGRQKLYRIHAGSNKDVSSGGMTRGKHMYENDVALSAFQQMRLKEKEQRELREQQELDERTDRSSYPNTEAEEHDSTRSPTTAFSQNRGTQSSTNSGPSNRRTSTAATSVMSESPVPPQTSHHQISKVREQDANSSAESIGFANSPGFRHVVRDDGRPTFRLSGSRSAVNMRDNYTRQSPVPPPPPSFRGMSPPLSAASHPLDFGLKETTRSNSGASRFQTASPTTQFEFEQDEALASSVRPNDRGKATAMGLFNKPARNYDDAQFQQRQVQMHEGRNSPISTSSRAASRASPEPSRSSRPSYGSTSSPMPQEEGYTPQIPPIPDYPPSPTSGRRSSANSTGRRSTSRPRTKSSSSTKEVALKARVDSIIRRQNAELAAMEASHLGQKRAEEGTEASASSTKIDGHGTFFDNSDDSDYEDHRRPSATSLRQNMPAPPPPADVHPALREGLQDFNFGTEELKPSTMRDSKHSVDSRPLSDKPRQSEHDSVRGVEDTDSPTIPAAGLGLSGLIRTHLRSGSDRSSMLPPPSPLLPGADNARGSISSTTRTVTESVKSDPFEYDNDRLGVRQPTPQAQAPLTPTTAMSLKAQQILGMAMAHRDAQAQNQNTPKIGASGHEVALEAESSPIIDAPKHQRNESTETQREQQRFDDELAERRKRIQETLVSVQERSRSRSPHGGFSLPRFPGRSNTGDRFEASGQSKAMKMLGIASGPRDQPSPRIPMDNERDRSRTPGSRQGHRPSPPHDRERSQGRQTPNSGRPGARPGPNYGYDRPPPPRSTTPSSRPGARSRSNSAAADRSTSRNKHIPDFDPAMMPGAFPGSPFASASPQNEQGQRSDSSASQSYVRNGSSAASNYGERSYFNAKSLVPAGPLDMARGFTPRPSPRPSPNPGEGVHQSQFVTPMSPPSSAMPSPNPAVANSTNGRTTPSAIPGRATPSGTRKKSVTKGMISDPKFVSSTSTVPLVHLPRDGGPAVEPMMTPPIPAMNPRRRGTADEQSPSFAPHPGVRPIASPLPIMPESPNMSDFNGSSQSLAQQPSAKPRNKLRKASSEGGSMAARARHQALAVEMAREKDRSPNVAVFPNHSATSLQSRDGAMF